MSISKIDVYVPVMESHDYLGVTIGGVQLGQGKF
jgi:hypothetical protein